MAPKTAKTIEVKGKKGANSEATKPKPKEDDEPKPKPVAKKPRAAVTFTALPTNEGIGAPIDVTFEGGSQVAKSLKTGGFIHNLKLVAPLPFSLSKTIVFPPDSEYAGQQAIILSPAKGFPLAKLSPEVRARVYEFYFAGNGKVGSTLTLDGKRSSNKDIYAKTYADGQKNRVALLATNKEIHNEATPIFYNHAIGFETTTALLDFLSQVPVSVRPLLRNIEIRVFVKTTARNALQFLAEARNLRRLHIDQGVFASNDGKVDVLRAAKSVYTEAGKFLQAMGAEHGDDRAAGVDVLAFGSKAFTRKDEKDRVVPWSEVQKREVLDQLRARMQAERFLAWTCICGSLMWGHTCVTEFEDRKKRRHQQKQKRPRGDNWEHIAHGGGEMLLQLENHKVSS